MTKLNKEDFEEDIYKLALAIVNRIRTENEFVPILFLDELNKDEVSHWLNFAEGVIKNFNEPIQTTEK